MFGEIWDTVETVLEKALLWLDGVASPLPLIDGWSWGLAVMLLTLGCRILLLPTLLVQVRFLRRMEDLAPEIEAIKERHRVGLEQVADHPVRAAAGWVRSEEEQDALLKERGVRWYVGLLPALVQIPAVVAVLRVLGSDSRTSGLTPATWSFVPPPTTSFMDFNQGLPLLGALGCFTMLLVHLGQRRSIGASPNPPSPVVRRLRLLVLPPVAALLVLNLGLAIMVSVLTSLVWGLGQSGWLAARQRAASQSVLEGAES